MKDIYTEVTNRIIQSLEAGTPPWIQPWTDHTALPSNLATGKPYRGINILMLCIEAQLRSYPDSRWLTYKQAGEVGAHVKKGEHGTQIVFFKMKEVGDEVEADDEQKRVVPMLRSYTVFNASQLEFLPEKFELRPPPAVWQPLGEAEQLLYETGAVIHHGGNRAFYRPSDDIIQLPPEMWFDQPDDYYAVALHETVHWTGHPRRLNRVLGRRHGIEAYAYEELVAEIGAAFLCAHVGIPARLEHASYIDSWLDSLRRDKRLIFTAAGAAQKAADYVLGESLSAPAPCIAARPTEELAA
ncbi:MAG: zincin-like metallopeptidase domain-containing protein [Actinomycetes bacterium]|jgi:antirestriction protein ArdC